MTTDQPHGRQQGGEALPPLQEAVSGSGHPVVWACDPMHGNTFVSEGGRKTRHFDDVLKEISGFFCRLPGDGDLARVASTSSSPATA